MFWSFFRGATGSGIQFILVMGTFDSGYHIIRFQIPIVNVIFAMSDLKLFLRKSINQFQCLLAILSFMHVLHISEKSRERRLPKESLFVALREKCPNTEFFWSSFSRIQSEYGKIQTRKNSVSNTFYSVAHLVITLSTTIVPII